MFSEYYPLKNFPGITGSSPPAQQTPGPTVPFGSPGSLSFLPPPSPPRPLPSSSPPSMSPEPRRARPSHQDSGHSSSSPSPSPTSPKTPTPLPQHARHPSTPHTGPLPHTKSPPLSRPSHYLRR